MPERLHAHREWANQKIIDWYLALPEPDEYCLKMLSHLLLSEAIWLFRLGSAADPERSASLTPWQMLQAEELKPLAEANNTGWREVLKSDISRNVRYRRF